MKRFILAFLAAAATGTTAFAHTVTFTWTWPTLRADGSAMPLTAYGSFTVYNTGLPAPGGPGTPVACPVTLPPTTATGTCTTGTLAAGSYGFVAVTTDNSNPPQTSTPSNAPAIVVIPLTGPAAITDFKATVN